MIKLAVFDCDGTLVDSQANICRAMEDAFLLADIPAPPRAAIRRIVGLSLVEAIRALGGTLVDMEAYAYIWVAQQFGVPIRILKAVSDNAQDDAITDWRDAVAICSAQLRERITELYGV
jgi:phosphoglycolate phosphatase-like HAD superfamily hydrolase